MWIVLFEEEVVVREVKEARSIVGHDIGLARDEEPPRAVPMESLMSTGFVAE